MSSAAGVGEAEHSLRINVCNGFAAVSSQHGPLAIRNRKACGLLAYLALNQKRAETRERLAGLLWSDRGEPQARASLRQCLKQLRGTFDSLGLPALRTDRQLVAIDAQRVDTDLERMARQVKSGSLGAEGANGGIAPAGILQGFEGLDQAFDAWLHVLREQWQRDLSDDLEGILRNPQAAAAVRKAAAEALLQLDPTNEAGHRHLIGHYAAAGNTAAALRQYNELWQLLGDDYDMEPAEETQQLIARVKSGSFPGATDAAPAAPSPPPPAPQAAPARVQASRPVLEIRPFRPEGRENAPGYLLEGFRRDLIASLVRFREWAVVEATAEPPPDDAAAATGPQQGPFDYALDGIFHGDEQGQVHLMVTLKETAHQRYIWNERYTLSPDAWFDHQEDIVRRMSVALNVSVSAERLAQQMARPDVSRDVYDQWLKGQNLILRWEPEPRRQAEQIFRTIIARAPDFAPAYSGLASICNTRHIVTPGVFRTRALEEEATAAAQRAVELDPLDTRGQLALAWSNAMRGRFDQAEHNFSLAHELNASNPTTIISCAQGWAFCGDHLQARALAEQAVRINPLMPPYHVGYLVGIRFLGGDYEGCVAAADSVEAVISNLPGWKAAALALLGRTGPARDTAQAFVRTLQDRWAEDAPWSPAEAARWFLHCFPIRRREDRNRLAGALRTAGLAAG